MIQLQTSLCCGELLCILCTGGERGGFCVTGYPVPFALAMILRSRDARGAGDGVDISLVTRTDGIAFLYLAFLPQFLLQRRCS